MTGWPHPSPVHGGKPMVSVGWRITVRYTRTGGLTLASSCGSGKSCMTVNRENPASSAGTLAKELLPEMDAVIHHMISVQTLVQRLSSDHISSATSRRSWSELQTTLRVLNEKLRLLQSSVQFRPRLPTSNTSGRYGVIRAMK